jgi:FMN reductase (NADPH)
MLHNPIVDLITNHRSIRKFKDQPLSEEQLQTLYAAASQTSTSMFMQQFSILHVTDAKLRKDVQSISGQPYVGANGELFVFVVDLYRNQQIRRQLGKDDGRLHTTDIFFQAVEDTVLALQNFLTAAESLGLGGVILGSIKDDPAELVRVLDMPKMTLPLLGLQVGVPDQEPQLKPRLPKEQIAFENHYPTDFKVDNLHEYDEVVTTYYDLREANRRIDSFTKQISGVKLAVHDTSRDKLAATIQSQGLALDWGKD